MRKIFIPVAMLLLLSFVTTDTPLTKSERQYALAKLKATQAHFKEALKGLSPEQLNFKATDSSWSVAECAEHIAISESLLYGMMENSLKSNPDPSKRGEVKTTDDQLWAMVTDRSSKYKTQEAFKPTGKFGSFESTVQEFNSKRNAHIDYVKKTSDDLRNRYVQLPFATIDAFQAIIFLTAHTERHVKQIEEVKSDPGFPGK